MSRSAVAHQPFSSLCYAPFVSMYFDVRGNVIACCQNTSNVLGNVNKTPLLDIWRGEAATAMRTTLAAGDFASGCDFCEWQQAHADGGKVFAELFDQYPAGSGASWPTLLEFSMSNRCNLACTMCNGDFSSTIRSQREHRPPLVTQYPERFFDDLRPFLAHLKVARFLGGEPFLVPEYHRIWDLIVEERSEASCDVTTNGTVRTRRVEAALDAIPFSIGVSIDGVSRSTIEAIRVGADFDTVMANITWFRRYCTRTGTGFGLTFCLMTQNHDEFFDFLRFAEDLDASVAINTVVYPPQASLYRLPRHELERVIDSMERQRALARPLGPTQSVWDGELARLRAWAQKLHDRTGRVESLEFFERWSPPASVVAVDVHTRDLEAWAGRPPVAIEVADGHVASVVAPLWAAWLEVDTWIGEPVEALETLVENHLDEPWSASEHRLPDGSWTVTSTGFRQGRELEFRVVFRFESEVPRRQRALIAVRERTSTFVELTSRDHPDD